jgi:hypothetical protein
MDGECDTARVCGGKAATCSPPQFVRAGTPCNDGAGGGDGSGMCYAGLCHSQEAKCRAFEGIATQLVAPITACPSQGLPTLAPLEPQPAADTAEATAAPVTAKGGVFLQWEATTACGQMFCRDAQTDVVSGGGAPDAIAAGASGVVCHALPSRIGVTKARSMDDGTPCGTYSVLLFSFLFFSVLFCSLLFFSSFLFYPRNSACMTSDLQFVCSLAAHNNTLSRTLQSHLFS